MSGVAYARRHGINYQTFATWIQKRKRSGGDNGGTDQVKSKSRRLSSGKSPKMELTLAAGGLRVELPGGGAVMIEEAGQAELTAAVIRQLALDKTRCSPSLARSAQAPESSAVDGSGRLC